MSMTLAERFWYRVIKPSGGSEDWCWGWRGSLSNGYGHLTSDKKQVVASRVSWVLHFGEIPTGLFVCHKCDNRECTNARHLFLGSPGDNCKDKMQKGRGNQTGAPRQTHCHLGHRFTKNNTYINRQKKNGKIYETRYCRECRTQQGVARRTSLKPYRPRGRQMRRNRQAGDPELA